MVAGRLGPILVLPGSGIPGKHFLSWTCLPVSDMGQQQLPQESGELGLTGEGPRPGDRPEPGDLISILRVEGSSRHSRWDVVPTVGPAEGQPGGGSSWT